MLKLEFQDCKYGGIQSIEYDGSASKVLYETYVMLSGLFDVMADEENDPNFANKLVELIEAYDVAEDE